jgi:chromosome segregation ATPase
VESLSGKLGDHITGSSSNTANIVRSEVSVPILSYSSMANNQNIRSASVSEMPKTHLRSSNRESVTSSNTDWDALNENQNKNENLINDLKKQIDSLNKQLEHLGREDSKIINELSEKIENLAKMNVVSI